MPDPSTHRRAGTPRKPDPAWAEWSHAWTRHIPTLTGRTDLKVVVAPGAGGGAPACYYPHHARIEVDAGHIGDDPGVADPWRAGHKRLVPAAYGLLVHEAAHATHSGWHTPAGTPPVVAAVADLLEESRAEKRQRTRRRYDRQWLRTAVTSLISVDDAPVDDPWHAGWVAGLLLARVDARIITAKDARTAKAAVTRVIGRNRLRQLRDLWRQAHLVDDHDARAMVAIAHQWCQVLGIDPHRQPDIPLADLGVFPGVLAAAIGDYLAAAYGLTPAEHLAAGHGPPAGWTRRDPTPEEQRAARRLATRLQQARTHTKEAATVASTIPPGRLRTRQAIAAQAQREAGMIPTATPWRKRADQPPPKPVLHLAVLVDASGSMRRYASPMSSAAWILAHAARAGQAATCTIAFGHSVTLLTPPRTRPTHVLEIHTWGGTHTFIGAVKLADRLLGLRHQRTLRMLAVVSDGDLADVGPAQKLLTTLHRTGCAVLWLRPADLPGHTFDHTTTITVDDPVQAIEHLADAAVTALEHA